MSGFSNRWLAQRESADAHARHRGVHRALAQWATVLDRVRVVDLGAGSGSNRRYLSSYLGAEQRWTLLDRDAALLRVAAAQGCETTSACTLASCNTTETRVLDLAAGVPDFADADLVTASALLDLVSDAWLMALVDACRGAQVAVLFALSYDGNVVFDPRDDYDGRVCELVNAHQLTDKGFGPALGPQAGSRAAALLQAAGFEVVSGESPWRLGVQDADLQCELLAGWRFAACAIAPDETDAINAWGVRRLARIRARASRVSVGHVDSFARP